VKPRFIQVFSIGLGSGCETVWNPNAVRRQFTVHLAERRVLSAYERDIVDADLIEPPNQICRNFRGTHENPFVA
jgi:hypothetical protein